MFGYLGAGMTEVARALFGQSARGQATMRLEGRQIRPRSSQEAKGLGIAYLTENRRATIFPRHEIFKNITLAHLEQIVRPIFRQSSELAVAATWSTGRACGHQTRACSPAT